MMAYKEQLSTLPARDQYGAQALDEFNILGNTPLQR
jgi:hypothetical protein